MILFFRLFVFEYIRKLLIKSILKLIMYYYMKESIKGTREERLKLLNIYNGYWN